MSDLLELRQRWDSPDTVLVTALGEIDLSNCDELEAELRGLNGASEVVLDLTPCTFFDSSCLRILVRYARARNGDGRTFRVIANENGRQTITLTALDGLLNLNGSPGAGTDGVVASCESERA